VGTTNNQDLTFDKVVEGEDELTFEKAMHLLEETVRRLEAGDLPLTESIERYKSAMTLVQYCRKQLDKAELEIEQLMTTGNEETPPSQEGDN
jgi:exodeoxyribonuclease VII small subunit